MSTAQLPLGLCARPQLGIDTLVVSHQLVGEKIEVSIAWLTSFMKPLIHFTYEQS